MSLLPEVSVINLILIKAPDRYTIKVSCPFHTIYVHNTRDGYFFLFNFCRLILLGFSCRIYVYSGWWKILGCEWHIHLKEPSDLRNWTETRCFPYTFEKWQVVELNLLVLTDVLFFLEGKHLKYLFRDDLYDRLRYPRIYVSFPLGLDWVLGKLDIDCRHCLQGIWGLFRSVLLSPIQCFLKLLHLRIVLAGGGFRIELESSSWPLLSLGLNQQGYKVSISLRGNDGNIHAFVVSHGEEISSPLLKQGEMKAIDDFNINFTISTPAKYMKFYSKPNSDH